jgi:cell pole-organizing protein PopZ
MSGSNNEITNTGAPASSAEPSMEEILASIRRILKDDPATIQPGDEAEEEILLLDSTMMVKPGAGVSHPADPPAIAASPEAPSPEPELVAPEFAAEPQWQPQPGSELLGSALPDFDGPPAPAFDPPAQTSETAAGSDDTPQQPAAENNAMEEQNMSDEVQENVQPPHGLVSDAASEAAAGSIGALIRSISSDRQVAVGRVGLTLEDLVREELRPLLKAWLDSNLPALVERIVRAEIQRVIERTGV